MRRYRSGTKEGLLEGRDWITPKKEIKKNEVVDGIADARGAGVVVGESQLLRGGGESSKAPAAGKEQSCTRGFSVISQRGCLIA
jgi:hypothetical protein